MNTPPPELSVTHTSSVTADQIDELGHMNVRFYGRNAVAATQSVCAEYGIGQPRIVSAYTRHHNEQMKGNDLEVRSAVVATTRRLRLYHELRNRANDDLAATFVHELNHPALETPGLELPAYGGPRTLSLDTDALASAPDLDELRANGLAIRKPRQVTTQDTFGADTVSAWLAPNLIWGGEPLHPEESWIRTLESGERFAFVIAESRIWNSAHPITVGMPIESFRATIDVGTKIAREIAWSYDTSTGKPLVALESVDLCFNLSARKSMLIPTEGFGRHVEPVFAKYLPS